MLDSDPTQFQLSGEGEILWQEKRNNPLPGVPVAKLEKGAHILKPSVRVLENEHTQKQDKQAFLDHLNLWLQAHMTRVLESLMLIEAGEGAQAQDETVQAIAAKVYDGMGVVPREELEDLIAKLDPEKRALLRLKKIRLGPVLAFIPALNKPAAVRLRGLLWCLYHGAPLPANVPADGIVSATITDESANAVFYRSIGYPLYGGRAVRIDMLDRVINAVYENAKHGKFHAQHQMAEWLGCGIEDLYRILEAMGHKKIHDPAEEKLAAEEAAEKTALQEQKSEPEAPQQEDNTKEASEEDAKPEEKKPEEKPELATFALKRGKAFDQGGKGGFQHKKPHSKGKPDKKKDFDKKKSKSKKDFRKDKKDRGPRVISIEAEKKAEDSPFAILEQLKNKADG